MLVLVVFLLQAASAPCGPDAMAALAQAGERRERGGAEAAASSLAAAAQAFSSCVPLVTASAVMTGWLHARAAAAKGGSPESLAPARGAVAALEPSSVFDEWRVQREYARAAISAAMAAAQDERSDMSLYLTHARSLSDRLALTGERADWPGPIDELDGELWLEVDRFADARAAYQRAVDSRATPVALIGLARASDRLNDEPAACAAYRRAAVEAEGTLAQEAKEYLKRSGCQRQASIGSNGLNPSIHVR